MRELGPVIRVRIPLFGAVWLAMHAAILLLLWWGLRAPLFYMAVGSQAISPRASMAMPAGVVSR